MIMLWLPLTVFAAQPKVDKSRVDAITKKDEKPVEKKIELGEFEYTSEGRRDPFQPVLLLRAKSSREAKPLSKGKDGKEIAEAVGYELEELKLVGVLKSDKGMIAMMEDTQGKGIFFRKGDHLNQNMWVADITSLNVILAYKLKGEIKKVVVDIPSKK